MSAWFLIIIIHWPGNGDGTHYEIEYATETACLAHLSAMRLENEAGGESEWVIAAWCQPHEQLRSPGWTEMPGD